MALRRSHSARRRQRQHDQPEHGPLPAAEQPALTLDQSLAVLQQPRAGTAARSNAALGLQRTLGNSRARRALATPSLQRKAPDSSQPKAKNPNAILGELQTTGASDKTAASDRLKQGGVVASHKLAQADQERLKRFAKAFVEVGAQYNLPPALLAAIASRESRGGSALAHGYGDHGHAYGIMQMDVTKNPNTRTDVGIGSTAHIQQAAALLNDMRAAVSKKHPQWTAAQQLRGAVAAYNFGAKNVQSLEKLDLGSTHDDYSADVWARAQHYATLPEFGSVGELLQAKLPDQAAATQQPDASSLFGGLLDEARGLLDTMVDAAGDVTSWLGDLISGPDDAAPQSAAPQKVPGTQVAITKALAQGIRDETQLTDLLFHARHPELHGHSIQPEQQALKAEWLNIRDSQVRPVLAQQQPAKAAPAPTSKQQAAQTASTPAAVDANKLSGVHWVAQYPTSASTDTLNDPFKGNVETFIALLRQNNAAVQISATYRPPERAYLMHYAYLIATGALAYGAYPTSDPHGIGIVWDHGSAAASRKAAQAMVAAYHIKYQPALTSRHIEGRAIDMTITNLPEVLRLPDGSTVAIGSAAASANQALWEVARGLGVVKHPNDAPHWSDDGR